MKRDISNKELVEGAKKWLESFSNAEWCRKLEEENYLNELGEDQSLEWLNNEKIEINNLPNIKCEKTSIDKRSFRWSLLDSPNANKEPFTPITYTEVPICLEAA